MKDSQQARNSELTQGTLDQPALQSRLNDFDDKTNDQLMSELDREK